MYENPFTNSRSVTVNGSNPIYFDRENEHESIEATEAFMRDVKSSHPDARIYGSLKFGDFKYRVSY